METALGQHIITIEWGHQGKVHNQSFQRMAKGGALNENLRNIKVGLFLACL